MDNWANRLLIKMMAIDPALLLHRVSEQEVVLWEQMLTAAEGLPETVYEECMFARILIGHPGLPGLLLIRFPAGLDLKHLPLHYHPQSHRRVAVLSGNGHFYIHREDGAVDKFNVSRGDIVSFMRGSVHTFTSADEEMRVLAVHDPFQWLDDTEILKLAEPGTLGI